MSWAPETNWELLSILEFTLLLFCYAFSISRSLMSTFVVRMPQVCTIFPSALALNSDSSFYLAILYRQVMNRMQRIRFAPTKPPKMYTQVKSASSSTAHIKIHTKLVWLCSLSRIYLPVISSVTTLKPVTEFFASSVFGLRSRYQNSNENWDVLTKSCSTDM